MWAEPCLIDAAKEEYDGVIEEFLATGEKLFGPYVWGRCGVTWTHVSVIKLNLVLSISGVEWGRRREQEGEEGGGREGAEEEEGGGGSGKREKRGREEEISREGPGTVAEITGCRGDSCPPSC